MKNSNNYMLLIFLIVSVAGCTANYRPKDGTPVSKLLFTTNKGFGMFVGLWKVQTEKCPSLSQVKLLTDSQTDKKNSLVVIEAGEPFVVKAEMVNIRTGRICNDAGVFTPKQGTTYQLKHTVNSQGCWLEMYSGDSVGKDHSFKQFVNLDDKSICSGLVR